MCARYWGLEDGFKKYVNEDCTFCGSLVDRIVPGRIRDEKEVAELEQKHGYSPLTSHFVKKRSQKYSAPL